MRLVMSAWESSAEVDKLGGVYLVCSDHGNADDMVQVRFEGQGNRVEEEGTPVSCHPHVPQKQTSDPSVSPRLWNPPLRRGTRRRASRCRTRTG